MSCVFQNIAPPPSPPAFFAGGHTRWVERGAGDQYFGRRKKQLCTLPLSNPLWVQWIMLPNGPAEGAMDPSCMRIFFSTTFVVIHI
jgi:hypothetical protein